MRRELYGMCEALMYPALYPGFYSRLHSGGKIAFPEPLPA
jgi:hypothetical protein